MAANFESLNKVFLDTIKKKNQGALSAVIFDNEKILFSFYDGLIDKDKKLAPKEDSLFMIGSNTKVFTSLGIFRLLEDGKLKLEDPITNYIPEFSVKSRIGDYPVTIESLLMHRAGIQCDLYPFMVDDKKTYDEMIAAMKETYRTTVPGTMFSYSNLGFTLLGIIEERISGKKYYDFIKEILLDPLGIELYIAPEKQLPAELSDRVAKSYDEKGKRAFDPLAIMYPAGPCTYTTLGGLAKIGQLLMNDGECGGVRLYKPETIQLMKTLKVGDELDNSLICIGYGLMHHSVILDYKTGRVIGHGGDTEYHHSKFDFLRDEKIGVIVFSNFAKAPKLTRDIQVALFNEYLKEEGFQKKEAPNRKTVDFDPNKYAGKYDSMLGPIEFKVTPKGELTTTLQTIQLSLKLDEEGWLAATPKALWTRLTPVYKQLAGCRFLQTPYYGNDVLVLEQKGVRNVIGEKYKTPSVNTAWLKAAGTYKPTDAKFKDLLTKATLGLKDGEPVITLLEEGQKLDIYLDIVDENEAIVKGFGRNSKQTVFLSNDNGTYRLTLDGVEVIRK